MSDAEYGPDDIEPGDEIVFLYGADDRRSVMEVAEVGTRKVRLDSGGHVYYRDIVEVRKDGE